MTKSNPHCRYLSRHFFVAILIKGGICYSIFFFLVKERIKLIRRIISCDKSEEGIGIVSVVKLLQSHFHKR